MNELSEKVIGESIAAPSSRNYLSEWLRSIAARNSPATLERYKNTVALFLKSLDSFSDQPITAVSPTHVEKFLNARLNSGVAPKTAVVDLKTLNTAFRGAENYGYILKNPVSAVPLPKQNSSEREVFTPDEVKRLLDAATDLDWQTLIMLGYFTGARLGDCVALTWENVRPEECAIVYTQKKTGKRVIVPMHYNLIEHLDHVSQFGTEGPLCPKLANLRSSGKTGLSERFRTIAQRAGVDLMTVQGKGTRKFSKRTFHSLRHSFNSALANAGVSQEVRMKLTGHSSNEMNSRYTHMDLNPLKNAITALPMFKKTASPHTDEKA